MEPTPPPIAPPPITHYPRYQYNGSGDTCPNCSSPDVFRVKYTWWGGILGPSMMNLTHCRACDLNYNAGTRKDASTAIRIIVIFSWIGILALAVAAFATISMVGKS